MHGGRPDEAELQKMFCLKTLIRLKVVNKILVPEECSNAFKNRMAGNGSKANGTSTPNPMEAKDKFEPSQTGRLVRGQKRHFLSGDRRLSQADRQNKRVGN